MDKKDPHIFFKDFQFISNTDIMFGILPEFIYQEIYSLSEKYKKIKDHKFSILREHLNVGKNSYQISVTGNDLRESFIFPYLIRLGEYYVHTLNRENIKNFDRKIILRNKPGHYDEYDFWFNYGYKGDINPRHKHTGHMSGVLYIKNPNNVPTKFDDVDFIGQDKSIIIFPSERFHRVDELIDDQERITIAFNLIYIN